MKVIICLFALVAVAYSQLPMEAPIPYSFSYGSPTEDGGSSSHQETGDEFGRKSGFYTLTDWEGHNRVVEYVADEAGFRAIVRTNEPGTANMNPANVIMESYAPDAAFAPVFNMGVPGAAPVLPSTYAATYPGMTYGAPRVPVAPRVLAPATVGRYMLK